jgi:site-specific recombinase XerD
VAIRLEDLLASFRRHLRAAAKAPGTIELYSQSVRYFSRWLSDRGREPVLDELTRHAVAASPPELAETAEPSPSAPGCAGMRRFCRWLVTEGEPAVAPTGSRGEARGRRDRLPHADPSTAWGENDADDEKQPPPTSPTARSVPRPPARVDGRCDSAHTLPR